MDADSARQDYNHLSDESSPYLLQHADNPVHWYPWGEEAFEKARREDKPVFVSIGYATCHWCHVMAHESFEDEEIASLMNEAFVNIKVDREERPDIDNTYMLVCQMMTGQGGWPLNVLLTPEKEPFYAATYIPRTGRHGRPGMRELIPWISQIWENERKKITNSATEIINAFHKSNAFESGEILDHEVLEDAYLKYRKQFDEEYGGFGSSPKFPSPHNLMFLLRYAKQNPDSDALLMVERTLTQMRRGGIFDHVGLGFHRYSTDHKWLLPHFEKMLYDQAMLLMAYTEAWQLSAKELYRQTVDEIIAYLARKMRDENGGYYSAEDADSEGEEGKFYVWTVNEIRQQLPASQAELAIEVFNVSGAGNYREEASGQKTGRNILHLTKSLDELATERNMDESKLAGELEDIRSTLLEVRQQRVAPLLDDKILTDWNGLTIAALAKAGRALNNEQYIDQAEQCWSFIEEAMLDDTMMLKHRYRNGDAAIEGHADDYAFVIWGLIELYQATFNTHYLQKAVSLNQAFIERFWDNEKGGFYFTSATAEELLGRKKEIYDGAMPSSNSVAMLNLMRLGRLTGKTEWEQKANNCQKLFSSDINKTPTSLGMALQSVAFTTGNAQEIIISGVKERGDTNKFLELLNRRFLPNAVVLLNDPSDNQLANLAPFVAEFGIKEDQTTAYVCQNYSCELPTTDPEAMLNLLKE